MSKAAIIVLADIETHEDLGRVVNAMRVAGEFKDAGDDVVMIFDGAGTRWVPELADPSHDHHGLYEDLREITAGACDYCSGAFGVKEKVAEVGVTLLDEYKGHPSTKRLVDQGYEVITF